jgi:hypothetical protein
MGMGHGGRVFVVVGAGPVGGRVGAGPLLLLVVGRVHGAVAGQVGRVGLVGAAQHLAYHGWVVGDTGRARHV